MSAEKSDAIVTRLTDFSETSRVVVLFTREFGRISAIAKGGRRLKGPFDTALDLLAQCRIVFLRRSSAGLDILTEAKLLSRFVPRKRDLKSLYGGYYVAELLNSLTEEYDPLPEIYDAAQNVLRQLADEDSPGTAILQFELRLLRELGHLPEFEECVACRSSLSNQSAPLAFWVSQGGMLCARCQKEQYAKHPIHAGTLALLRQFAEPSNPIGPRIPLSPEQHTEMRSIVTSLMSHLLGRRPKMARYLNL